MRTLISYLSYSGNTEEVAQYIESRLKHEGFDVDMHEIGIDLTPDVSVYDFIFLGTFTWDLGSTPEEMKDFIWDVGYKPENVAVFGSGDTQFGGDSLFCKAVDKLVTFYHSKWEGLKVEQSPRGHQEKYIDSWLERVLEDVRVIA
ncbi:flavodoxin [Pseudogracilibacillus auburnensis]|uniref:Putative ribonucleotide reductase-associated flavodoxin n=1 Tax=Pseudogracilibacillus auburnensis TaxID=1494959 RepID=A0A2V3W2T9_9BACI|nr:flavodoxin [Pseudogracilibacillus auburnensis]MBO1002187.1 flavodoxin [Pseudogracilibacillus auburnensis]PXW87514.1 putative ribonucleotide reductase-associated flavodoxin [Pseudogracilibacillus auburnensis]